jgi:hypothetical protein
MKNTARFVLVAALGAVLVWSAAALAQLTAPEKPQAQTLAESIRASLGPAKWTQLQPSSKRLIAELGKVAASPTLAKKVALAATPAQLPADIRSSVEQAVTAYATLSGERDPAKVLSAVTALSTAEAEKAVQAAAQKLLETNEAKAKLAESLAMLQAALAAGAFPVTLTITTCTIAGGTVQTATAAVTFANKAAVEAEIQELESQLQEIGEMAQMDLMDLQDKQQKQQQMIQLMSNISRSFHETAKAIIQNIKA